MTLKRMLVYDNIPTFFLMSFYYTHKNFSSFNISKIKLRFERLVIPYICWNIISFVLNNIYYFILGKRCLHTFNDFFKNILNGHMFIVSLWFQNILIFTTLIVTIIVLMFEDYYLLIFQILIILSFRFQYSLENYRLFQFRFSMHYRLTYGRFFETLPHSLTGFFIGVFDIPAKFKRHKLRTRILGFLILIFISKNRFDYKLEGFKYGGIRLNIAAIFLFLVFFSFDTIGSMKIIKIVDIITNYTAGIYFIHFLIGNGYIIKLLLGNKIKTIYGCLILYLVSYFLCFFLDLNGNFIIITITHI